MARRGRNPASAALLMLVGALAVGAALAAWQWLSGALDGRALVPTPAGPTPAAATPLGPSPSPTPSLAPPGRRLIYKEFGREADAFYLAEGLADASLREVKSLASISHASGYGIQGALSADGKGLAYTVVPAGASGQDRNAELWVLAPADPKPRRLLGGLELQTPVWSPGGDAVALRRYGSQGSPELVLVGVDGRATPLALGAGALDLFPVGFTPDGLSVLYVKLSPQGSELGRAARADRSAVMVGSLGRGLSRDWRLSPDGRFLAYLAPQEVEGRIRLRLHLAPVGGDGRPLAIRGAAAGLDHFAPLWHPRGGEIALGSAPRGAQGQGVLLVAVEDGQARLFGAPPARGCDVPAAWAADGGVLAVRSFSLCSPQAPGPSHYVLLTSDGRRVEMKAGEEFLGWLP